MAFLGLVGPVIAVTLEKALLAKGLLHEPALDDRGEIRDDLHGEPLVDGVVWHGTPEGFVPERVNGTRAQIEERQDVANHQTAEWVRDSLLAGLAGLGAGKAAFQQAGQFPGTPDLPPLSAEPPLSPGKWTGGDTRVRGRAAEAYLAGKLPGTMIAGGNDNFDNFDRAVYGPGGPNAPAVEVGQVKSIDTLASSYQGSKLRSVIVGYAGEVGGPGESIWEKGGHKIVIGPDTKRVLDVAIPNVPLTPKQAELINLAKEDAATMDVEVRVHIVP